MDFEYKYWQNRIWHNPKYYWNLPNKKKRWTPESRLTFRHYCYRVDYETHMNMICILFDQVSVFPPRISFWTWLKCWKIVDDLSYSLEIDLLINQRLTYFHFTVFDDGYVRFSCAIEAKGFRFNEIRPIHKANTPIGCEKKTKIIDRLYGIMWYEVISHLVFEPLQRPFNPSFPSFIWNMFCKTFSKFHPFYSIHRNKNTRPVLYCTVLRCWNAAMSMLD